MRASNNMILRQIAGESILIPVGEAALKIHGMISLSESGLLLWKKLQTADCTYEQLAKVLQSEYEVEYDTAISDVKEFVGQMIELGIVAAED